MAWLAFASENLQVCQTCLREGFYNPTLQNAQQAVEKAIKAVVSHHHGHIRKSHSIAALVADLESLGVVAPLLADEIHLLDSIYLPSKYPLASALPDYVPDEPLARKCMLIAERIIDFAQGQLNRS